MADADADGIMRIEKCGWKKYKKIRQKNIKIIMKKIIKTKFCLV